MSDVSSDNDPETSDNEEESSEEFKIPCGRMEEAPNYVLKKLSLELNDLKNIRTLKSGKPVVIDFNIENDAQWGKKELKKRYYDVNGPKQLKTADYYLDSEEKPKYFWRITVKYTHEDFSDDFSDNLSDDSSDDSS